MRRKAYFIHDMKYAHFVYCYDFCALWIKYHETFLGDAYRRSCLALLSPLLASCRIVFDGTSVLTSGCEISVHR